MNVLSEREISTIERLSCMPFKEVVRMNLSTGVVIGRFQCHKLHNGHKKLLSIVSRQHATVVVLIGCSPLKSTKRNPLTFAQRKAMILEFNPSILVLPLVDVHPNELWSAQIDSGVPEGATLYGGRDSFIPYYSGTRECIELNLFCDDSTTFSRESITEDFSNAEEFYEST